MRNLTFFFPPRNQNTIYSNTDNIFISVLILTKHCYNKNYINLTTLREELKYLHVHISELSLYLLFFFFNWGGYFPWVFRRWYIKHYFRKFSPHFISFPTILQLLEYVFCKVFPTPSPNSNLCIFLLSFISRLQNSPRPCLATEPCSETEKERELSW